MRFNKLMYPLIVLALFSSCAAYKINKTLSEGNIVQKDFKVTVPFEYRNGLIIIKVTIQGEVYDFILDSGASNVLSKELADKLKVIPLGSEEVGDIHDENKQLKYTKIDDIQIGGINFQETIAVITDFNNGALACLNADGFIGSNLMRFAVWDFDFNNQLITITNDEQKLNVPSDAIETKIFIGAASKPSISTQVNGDKVFNNVVDLGNNSSVRLSYITFLEQKESKKITNYIKGSGYTSIGIYGKGEQKNEYSAKIDQIQIGNHIIKDKVVRIKDGSSNLGISFFKNYRLILNWKSKKLKMIQEGAPLNTELTHFGFKPNFNGNKLFVDFIYNDTEASNILQFGDQILKINSIDYTNVTDEEMCDFFNNGIISKETDEIAVKILRNGEVLEFQLKKVRLL